MLGTLFAPLAMKISAGITAILLIALGVMLLVHKHDLSTADKLRTEVATGNAKLAVSNASIAALQGKIGEQNAAIDQQHAAYVASQKQAAADDAKNKALARTSDQQVARLKALAAKPGDGKCEASPALIDAIGGL